MYNLCIERMSLMWDSLPVKEKERYEKLILNFASLSEAFAQKTENEDTIVAPIVNSKFQETAFQKCFNAYAEDIANTSYDASIKTKNKRYLIGIKTFGKNSGDQKIAQFKSISGSDEWTTVINSIQKRAKNITDKEKIDEINHDLYLNLARKIAKVRNERIESSKENLRGFSLENDVQIEAVYHVLMTSSKNEMPEISVGEIGYSPIDIDNIQELHCTTPKTPQNFVFNDGIHEYKWTAADSQLYMKFHNSDIVLKSWPVKYVDDAFAFFENMNPITDNKVLKSHSWLLKVQPYSGFNAFMGQPKMPRKNKNREKYIQNIKKEYEDKLTQKEVFELTKRLEKLLLSSWNKQKDKQEMINVRRDLIDYVNKLGIDSLTENIQKNVYRPSNELELRIPNAWKFHQTYPNFFVEKSIFKDKTKKCVKNKTNRTFKLRFMPSGDEIDAYINQDSGKAIESVKRQSILGKWILRQVFQLEPYEPLTQEKLDEMNINGIRLTKKEDAVELSFIKIDLKNKPNDYWS